MTEICGRLWIFKAFRLVKLILSSGTKACLLKEIDSMRRKRSADVGLILSYKKSCSF